MTNTPSRRAPEPADGAPPEISKLVVARGTVLALVFALPAAMANVVLADQDPTPKAALNITLLVMLVGFALGGLLAGLEARSQAAKHGAIAGFFAFLPVQLIGLLGRIDRGDAVSIPQIIVLGFLAACAGTIGAQLGLRRRNRKASS